jgi:hypothetical protein
VPHGALSAPFGRHIIQPDESNMLYAINWFLVISLLALWSLAAWAMHATAMWALSHGGALTGAASEAASGVASAAEGLLLPEWLPPWVPAEVAQALSSLLSGLAPAVESLLQAGPALAGGLTVATWILWGLGSVLLILLGAGGHLLIAMWRRRGGGSGPQPTRQVSA